MSNRTYKHGKSLFERPGYEVGYGNPPKDSRFKPGQSGNPKGRPKGSKNKRPGIHEERMKEIILDEAYRGIAINDGERRVSVTMAEAVMRAIALKAVKGDHRSQRLFVEALGRVEDSRSALNREWMDKAINYKIEWEKELRRREKLGITDLPDPPVHPDQIRINLREGTVTVDGPLNDEEKAEWDLLVQNRDVVEELLDELTAQRSETDDPREQSELDKQIRFTSRLLARLGKKASFD